MRTVNIEGMFRGALWRVSVAASGRADGVDVEMKVLGVSYPLRLSPESARAVSVLLNTAATDADLHVEAAAARR